jgi:hypothetical protein
MPLLGRRRPRRAQRSTAEASCRVAPRIFTGPSSAHRGGAFGGTG